MFDGAFSPLHWLIVLAIALVVFGPKRVPEIGRSLGSAIHDFREALKGDEPAPTTPAAARPDAQRQGTGDAGSSRNAQ